MRTCACFLIAALFIANFAGAAAAVDPKIVAFQSRTSASAFNVEWTISAADAAACISSSACCFNAGTLITTLAGFVLTFQGAATGSICSVSSSLIVTITGTSEANYISGTILAITSNIPSSASLTAQSLNFSDGSANTIQSFKLKLPFDASTTTITSSNLASLPVTASSLSIIASTLFSLLAFFL